MINNDEDAGFELVDNQQPPPDDQPDQPEQAGTAVLEEYDRSAPPLVLMPSTPSQQL